MDPQQKTVLIALVAVAAFGSLALAVLCSIQNKAERTLDDRASREGYRIVRRTWAVAAWDRGPFRWTTASHYPVLNLVTEDAEGVRRECWAGCDVWTSGSLGRVEVVWKERSSGGGPQGNA